MTDSLQGPAIKIDEVALLKTYPPLKHIPKDHLQIVVLLLAGMNPTSIEEALDISRQTVYNVIKKYDVQQIIKDSLGIQRMLLANSLGTMAIEALSALVQKREDLKRMTPQMLLSFIQTCLNLSDAIRPKEKIEQKTTEELIDDLSKSTSVSIQPQV